MIISATEQAAREDWHSTPKTTTSTLQVSRSAGLVDRYIIETNRTTATVKIITGFYSPRSLTPSHLFSERAGESSVVPDKDYELIGDNLYSHRFPVEIAREGMRRVIAKLKNYGCVPEWVN